MGSARKGGCVLKRSVASAFFVVWVIACHARAEQAQRTVAGWVETLTFAETGLALPAKLDTGAKTSALDARDVVEFSRDGEAWVRFRIGENEPTVEARVVGERRVRSSLGRKTRLTVGLWVCFAQERRRVLFALGEREDMNYRVILGRRALEGRVWVDSERKFLLPPGCPPKAPAKASSEEGIK